MINRNNNWNDIMILVIIYSYMITCIISTILLLLSVNPKIIFTYLAGITISYSLIVLLIYNTTKK